MFNQPFNNQSKQPTNTFPSQSNTFPSQNPPQTQNNITTNYDPFNKNTSTFNSQITNTSSLNNPFNQSINTTQSGSQYLGTSFNPLIQTNELDRTQIRNNTQSVLNPYEIQTIKYKDLPNNIQERLKNLYTKIKTPSLNIQRFVFPEIENNQIPQNSKYYKKIFHKLIESEGVEVTEFIQNLNKEINIFNKEVNADEYINNLISVVEGLIRRIDKN